ncbi:SPOR domain-containing protein [Alkalimarinus sediminis]|uniref:SPOR domain-containing protein n=1 Tax=Alkalimarinus sediminis TaxID=1632866 RepID=A0A9E8HGX5_9ALTE|nr:SPOR domain-containing protein [Alkalimarinus sediminis]UZW74035.1 SPOR domain-containing protein [Alkalimarinus sediminis]
MTRDYAKPSTTKEPGKRSKERSGSRKPKVSKPTQRSNKHNAPAPRRKSTPWVIIACIIIASAFITGLVYLNKVPPTKATPPAIVDQNPPAEKQKPDTTSTTKERFKFYDLLPESEVIPPKVDAYQYKEKGKQIKYEYILQTGSFRNLKDAERQRAMIGFQGLKGQIEKVVTDSNSTWYRVQVGPYTSRSKMNSAMDKLVAINIQPLVKKNKR